MVVKHKKIVCVSYLLTFTVSSNLDFIYYDKAYC